MKYLCLPEDLAEANQLFNELSNINKRKKEIECRLSQIVAPKERENINYTELVDRLFQNVDFIYVFFLYLLIL